MAEAPPLVDGEAAAGGFWRTDWPDALRENLLGLLPSAANALSDFLRKNLFLIHTIGWPIIDAQGNATNYAGLHPRDARRALLQHMVDDHLRSEVDLLRPKVILAMGDAARDACSHFPGGAALRTGTLASHRENGIEITFSWGSVPASVTLLPVDRNLRDPAKRRAIRDDLRRFADSDIQN